MAVITGGKIMEGSHPRPILNAGAPLSGTTVGSFIGAPNGAMVYDTTNEVVYINEGSATSPYWTPVSYDQPNLLAWHSDFRDGVGKAIDNTDATTLLAGSGLRVFGQGIAETDSGLTVAQTAEVGPVASLIATNQASHVAAIGVGTTVLPFQPDTNGPHVIDVVISNLTNILTRAVFIGFAGAVADALDPAVTGSGTVVTLVQDDVAGILMDSRMTDAAGLFLPHNKSNEAASIDAAVDTTIDSGSDMAAAGTYQRFRVEISAAGVMTCFADKVEIGSIAASLDADEEIAPVLYIESTDANTKTLLVKRFATWGKRV